MYSYDAFGNIQEAGTYSFMQAGDPSRFAIESEISQAYERLSLLAQGFFVIRILGRCYGVKKWDATMLATSFDEVNRRLSARGNITPSFATDADAGSIAHAFRKAIYGEGEDGELFFGMSASQFRQAIALDRVVWAPDSDEAFDDGSYVLRFENESRVRLIAFLSAPNFLYDPVSLRDLHLTHDEF